MSGPIISINLAHISTHPWESGGIAVGSLLFANCKLWYKSSSWGSGASTKTEPSLYSTGVSPCVGMKCATVLSYSVAVLVQVPMNEITASLPVLFVYGDSDSLRTAMSVLSSPSPKIDLVVILVAPDNCARLTSVSSISFAKSWSVDI